MEEVQQKVIEAENQQQTRVARIIATICTPVFYEALVLTFLAGIVCYKSTHIELRCNCVFATPHIVHQPTTTLCPPLPMSHRVG